MGDPKKSRKKYSGPSHPWQKQRIDEENALQIEYGLANKKEIWRVISLLRNYKKIAKRSIVGSGQAQKEKDDLIKTLQSFGFIKDAQSLDDVLSLSPKNFFERRLQTIVFRKKYAHSMKQARQFITHGHIILGDRKITVPSYLVTITEEEGKVGFLPRSSLASADHPERQVKDGTQTKE